MGSDGLGYESVMQMMGLAPTEVGGFEWAMLWVGDVGVGVMLVWVCCVGRR